MLIGIVHTVGSPCQCAESVSEGLLALGHETRLVDSASIETQAATLAEQCDFVIDHTDTFCGRGIYRPFVRLLLENCGARVVGSSAQACFVADNKAAVKKILLDAGIPVPPGIVVNSGSWTLPEWLHPPFVIKPSFEHMSRGVRLIHTEHDVYKEVATLFESLHQPILVESYIPGRELAVSLIGNNDSLQALPILEWHSGSKILTEDFKLLEATAAAHKIMRADLEPTPNKRLEDLAHYAFHVLNLRDYARFDIRLSKDGCPYFLEVNTTPSLEPMEALAASANLAGINYPDLAARILSAAQERYPFPSLPKKKVHNLSIGSPQEEIAILNDMHAPPQSTIELARVLDINPGDDVLELGCGSGLLSIVAAKMGARHIVATDINPRALEAAEENARRNNVADKIEFRAGSWYEALNFDPHPVFDVIIATPPQTPGQRPFGVKYGGNDGTEHLTKVIRRAPEFLKPEEGRFWVLAISLANLSQIWKMLKDRFRQVELINKTPRPFVASEYDSIYSGLFEYLRLLRDSGISEFIETDSGQGYFHNCFIRARRPGGV